MKLFHISAKMGYHYYRFNDCIDALAKKQKEAYDKTVTNDNINKVIKDNGMFNSSEKITAVQLMINAIDHQLTAVHKPDVFSTIYTELKTNSRPISSCNRRYGRWQESSS